MKTSCAEMLRHDPNHLCCIRMLAVELSPDHQRQRSSVLPQRQTAANRRGAVAMVNWRETGTGSRMFYKIKKALALALALAAFCLHLKRGQ